ncbi:hypothetical protein [Actinomadura sp. K4S16]|uniref:hypothetical protein n=1 Tax=Actinomadura sp. K4S16 TaxID=1316147 RepID=UPI00190F9F2E|nr:hypothetical protein [Actinomadura sp. K4S16]
MPGDLRRQLLRQGAQLLARLDVQLVAGDVLGQQRIVVLGRRPLTLLVPCGPFPAIARRSVGAPAVLGAPRPAAALERLLTVSGTPFASAFEPLPARTAVVAVITAAPERTVLRTPLSAPLALTAAALEPAGTPFTARPAALARAGPAALEGPPFPPLAALPRETIVPALTALPGEAAVPTLLALAREPAVATLTALTGEPAFLALATLRGETAVPTLATLARGPTVPTLIALAGETAVPTLAALAREPALLALTALPGEPTVPTLIALARESTVPALTALTRGSAVPTLAALTGEPAFLALAALAREPGVSALTAALAAEATVRAALTGFGTPLLGTLERAAGLAVIALTARVPLLPAARTAAPALRATGAERPAARTTALAGPGPSLAAAGTAPTPGRRVPPPVVAPPLAAVVAAAVLFRAHHVRHCS